MNKLKKLRIKHNYSCSDMGNFLNISKAFYWQIENKRRRLTYMMALKIADIFDLKPDELFYEEAKKEC